MPRSRLLLIALAAVSLALYGLSAVPQLATTEFDDAYIFLRFARHWLDGHGFSWNVADGPVYGVSSVLHLLLVTAVRGLTSLPDPLALTVVSFLAGLAAVAVLVAMGRACFPRLAATGAPWLLVPILVLGPLFSYHGRTGMETTLALLCNALLAFAALRLAARRDLRAGAVCLLAAYAAFLARPDMGLYGLLLPPLLLLADDRRRNRRPALLYAGAFALLIAGDLLLKRALFGDALPLAVHAKAAGFYRGYLGADQWNAARSALLFLREGLPLLLAVAVFAGRRALPRLAAVLVPLLLTGAYHAGVVQIMGMQARYHYPALAFLVLAACLAVEGRLAAKKGHGEPSSPGAVARALVVVLLLVATTSPLIEAAAARAWSRLAVAEPEACPPPEGSAMRDVPPHLGWWPSIVAMDALLRRLPPDVTLAASEYGYIGARHPHVTILDLVGLQDREVARRGFSAEALLERRPDLVWLPHPDYSCLRRQILDDPRFRKDYELLPGAYDHGLAIAHASAHAEAIRAALAREFARIYPGWRPGDPWLPEGR